jgi:DNA-binding CsgD family transcriptional regulator
MKAAYVWRHSCKPIGGARLPGHGSYFDPRLAGATLMATVGEANVSAPRHGMTDREATILRLIAAGRSNQEIATELYLSPHTIKFHVSVASPIRSSPTVGARADRSGHVSHVLKRRSLLDVCIEVASRDLGADRVLDSVHWDHLVDVDPDIWVDAEMHVGLLGRNAVL